MARMPIELALIGEREERAVLEARDQANRLQTEFLFLRLSSADEQVFRMLAFNRVTDSALLDRMTATRMTLRGFHPFLIALLDAPVDGQNYGNLFGSIRGESGLGILTSAN